MSNDKNERQELAERSEEFRKALESHKRYDAELEQLVQRGILTPLEQQRVVQLKKMKLHMKDTMELIRKRIQKEKANAF